jgi:Ca-activated chloride channel family protein
MASNSRSSSAVASHRPRERRRWIGPVAAGAAVVIGATAVAIVMLRPAADDTACQGEPTTVTVAAAAAHFPVLSGLARTWSAEHPAVNGQCVMAIVVLKGSSEVAAALGPSWDTERDGPRPDVWVPDSRLWLLVAGSRPDAGAMLAADAPSIASSPVVLAVRRPVAEALGWPQRDLGWEDVLGIFSRPDLWEGLGHPEWAALRFGMTDPTLSTAGLAATLALLDTDANGELSDAELTAGVAFTQLLGSMAPDTTVFLNDQREAAAPSGGIAGSDLGVAAFPILERDVAAYDATGPEIDLVPVYAKQAPIVADFPFAILSTDWVDDLRSGAASQFLDFVLGPKGQEALAADGFRRPDQSAGDATLLAEPLGFKTTVAPPRPHPGPGAVSQLIADWTALQRQSNIIALLDTSGSMDEGVPGMGLSRLQLLQQTAVAGFGLLNNQSNIGLWQFATELTPTTDYRELVPYGPLTGTVGDVPRKQALIGAVQGLQAGGDTALYDTTYAAFQAIQALWEPNDTNAILLITDGRNDDDVGLTLEELLQRLAQEAKPERPTPVISIAVGPDADAEALREISRVTGGRTFVVRDANAAVQTLILAFAGRLR